MHFVMGQATSLGREVNNARQKARRLKPNRQRDIDIIPGPSEAPSKVGRLKGAFLLSISNRPVKSQAVEGGFPAIDIKSPSQTIGG